MSDHVHVWRDTGWVKLMWPTIKIYVCETCEAEGHQRGRIVGAYRDVIHDAPIEAQSYRFRRVAE